MARTRIEIAKESEKKHRQVLTMRNKGWTLARIADAIGGVSPSYVSAMLKKAKSWGDK